MSVPRLPLFEAKQLSKSYPMGDSVVHALRGIDLQLFEGECVVILGASGSGKSTLLNILGGLDTPTSGTLMFRDQDLSACDEHALTEFIATESTSPDDQRACCQRETVAIQRLDPSFHPRVPIAVRCFASYRSFVTPLLPI